jgi:ABC-type glutathione transport system ATPase component
MAIQSIVSFAILLLNDYRLFSKVWFFICHGFRFGNRNYAHLEDTNAENTTNHTISSIVPIADNVQISITHEDEDVKAEAERIQNTPYDELMRTDVLVLNQVEKIYNGVFRAVDQLSLGVKQSECFGLLGVNGA